MNWKRAWVLVLLLGCFASVMAQDEELDLVFIDATTISNIQVTGEYPVEPEGFGLAVDAFGSFMMVGNGELNTASGFDIDEGNGFIGDISSEVDGIRSLKIAQFTDELVIGFGGITGFQVLNLDQELFLTVNTPSPVVSLDFNPFGTKVAVALDDGTVAAYDIGSDVPSFSYNNPNVTAVTYGQNDALVSYGDNIIFTDANGAEALNNPASGAAILIDAAELANITAIISLESISIINVEAGDVFNVEAEESTLFITASLNAFGDFLAVGTSEGDVLFYDTATGELVGTLVGAHDGFVKDVVFSPSTEVMATAGQDNVARTWAIGSAANPQYVAAGSTPSTGTTALGQPQTTPEVSTADQNTADVYEMTSETVLETGTAIMDVTTFGSFIFASDDTGSTTVYDGENGEILTVIDPNESYPISTQVEIDPNTATLAIAYFNPENPSFDSIGIYDPDTGEAVAALEGHSDFISDLEFSPDGARLMSTSWDGTIRIYDVASGSELQTFSNDGDELEFAYTAEFDESGQYILVGSNLPLLAIWDTETMEILTTVDVDYPISDIAWSPDFARFYTTHTDGSIIVWDTNSIAPISEVQIEQHEPAGIAMLISVDVETGLIATSGQQNVIRAYEDVDGELQLIAVAPSVGEKYNAIYFVDDFIFSASTQGTVRLWG